MDSPPMSGALAWRRISGEQPRIPQADVATIPIGHAPRPATAMQYSQRNRRPQADVKLSRLDRKLAAKAARSHRLQRYAGAAEKTYLGQHA